MTYTRPVLVRRVTRDDFYCVVTVPPHGAALVKIETPHSNYFVQFTGHGAVSLRVVRLATDGSSLGFPLNQMALLFLDVAKEAVLAAALYEGFGTFEGGAE